MSAWESFKREATAAIVERARKVMIHDVTICYRAILTHHLIYPLLSSSPRISRIAWYLLSTVALCLLMVSLPPLCWASSAAIIRRWCSQWCMPLWEIRYWRICWTGTSSRAVSICDFIVNKDRCRESHHHWFHHSLPVTLWDVGSESFTCSRHNCSWFSLCFCVSEKLLSLTKPPPLSNTRSGMVQWYMKN